MSAGGCPSGGGACTSLVNVHWPLYTVVPFCSFLYYTIYVLLDRVCNRYIAAYSSWSRLNRRIWRQNICATIHTYTLVLLLTVVIIRSHAGLQGALLSPYYDPLAYVSVCMARARRTRRTCCVWAALPVLVHVACVRLMNELGTWGRAVIRVAVDVRDVRGLTAITPQRVCRMIPSAGDGVIFC